MLVAVDTLAVCAAFVVAFNLWTAPVRHQLLFLPKSGTLLTAGLWLVGTALSRVYEPATVVSRRASVQALATALGICVAGLLLTFFVTPYTVTRPTALLWAPLAATALSGARLATRKAITAPVFGHRIALVADESALTTLWGDIDPALAALYRVVAVTNPDVDGGLARLERLLDSDDVDQVVLGLRDHVPRPLFRLLLAYHEKGGVVRSLADLYEELSGRLLLDQLGHTWLMSLPMRNDTSRLYAAFKRSVDLLAASAALGVLAILLAPLALAITLDSRGPVFHRQMRVGRYGRPFRILKLRTMRVDPSREWTAGSDPRITRVGRVLRKLHLDELPQGWNIITGDMGLIGPRPEQPQYVERLTEDIDFYRSRLVVRPGLTGWAQINYGYGSGLAGARVKLSYDLYYIKHQSATLDLLIAGRTLLTLFSIRQLSAAR